MIYLIKSYSKARDKVRLSLVDAPDEQTTSEAKTEIRFGQKYLETLLKSMGLKNQPFKIEFGEGCKVCRVTSSQSVCEGLIMPLAVE